LSWRGTITADAVRIVKESRKPFLWRCVMLRWALVFLLVALVAGFLGFWGLEGLAMWFAKVLFVVFLVLFVLSLIAGRRGYYPP